MALSPGEAILHEGDPERCVVLLPGVRYFSQAPLLWFAREAAEAAGWSVLEVSERAPADADPFAWMHERAASALAATDAERVAVVGKSLGSVAASLAAERELPAIWLTPLLVRPDVVSALNATEAPALLIGSSADPTWADGARPANDLLERVEFDGLDHSLQVEGDPLASLDVLREVTERVGAFLADRLSNLPR
jgi:pimeloyl-ACP methyl ester carboxylesterase